MAEAMDPTVETPDRLNRHERRDAAENRQRVLEVAGDLFAVMGVEAVSMHQIALTAGVGQGTLYRRYANKGELCMDLMRASAERLEGEMDAYLIMAADAPALERLSGVLEMITAFIEVKRSYLSAIGEACLGDRRTSKYRMDWYRWLHGTIEGLLREATERGELRPLNPTFTADAILGALSPDLYQYQREERGLSREQILAGVIGLFIDPAVSA